MVRRLGPLTRWSWSKRAEGSLSWLDTVLSWSLRSVLISFFKTKSSWSIWNLQVFSLLSFLLVFSVMALGFRVTEEGLSGINLCMVYEYVERYKIPSYISIGSTSCLGVFAAVICC